MTYNTTQLSHTSNTRQYDSTAHSSALRRHDSVQLTSPPNHAGSIQQQSCRREHWDLQDGHTLAHTDKDLRRRPASLLSPCVPGRTCEPPSRSSLGLSQRTVMTILKLLETRQSRAQTGRSPTSVEVQSQKNTDHRR